MATDINRVKVKDALAAHTLAPAVLRQLGGGRAAVQSAIDAALHGAGSGFRGFTYAANTRSFTRRNQKAIAELAQQMADDLGESSVIGMIQGFACLKSDPPTEQQIANALWGRCDGVEVENALAWFALEEVGHAILRLTE